MCRLAPTPASATMRCFQYDNRAFSALTVWTRKDAVASQTLARRLAPGTPPRGEVWNSNGCYYSVHPGSTEASTWSMPSLNCATSWGVLAGSLSSPTPSPTARNTLPGFARASRAFGYGLNSLHEARDTRETLSRSEVVFCGGGNTFRLLKTLEDLELIEVLRGLIGDGMPYLGSSAGSNLACPTIMTTNDMPIVQPRSLAALGLVPFQINPHYIDSDPDLDAHGRKPRAAHPGVPRGEHNAGRRPEGRGHAAGPGWTLAAQRDRRRQDLHSGQPSSGGFADRRPQCPSRIAV